MSAHSLTSHTMTWWRSCHCYVTTMLRFRSVAMTNPKLSIWPKAQWRRLGDISILPRKRWRCLRDILLVEIQCVTNLDEAWQSITSWIWTKSHDSLRSWQLRRHIVIRMWEGVLTSGRLAGEWSPKNGGEEMKPLKWNINFSNFKNYSENLVFQI